MDDWYFYRADFHGTDLNRSSSLPNVRSPRLFSKEKHSKISDNNRSHIRRVFLAQEILHTDSTSPKILRQYSYQEIHSPHPSIAPPTITGRDLPLQQKSITYENVEEPMEIDTSLDRSKCKDTVESEDVADGFVYEYVREDNDQNNLHQRRNRHVSDEEIKPALRSLNPNVHGKTKENERISSALKSEFLRKAMKKKTALPFTLRILLIMVMIVAIMFLAAVVVFDYYSHIDINKLHEELRSSTHEQKDAIHAVINSLKYKHPNAQWHKTVKLLNFVGRSGVGKTYIANIVKMSFSHLLVRDLHSSQIENVEALNSVISSFYSNYCNLVVIDDLNVDHLDTLIRFIQKIEETDIFVLVIAVFSIHKVNDDLSHVVNYDDILKIHKRFDKTNIYHETVVFDEFSLSDAREYLGNKLKSYDVDVQHHNKLSNRALHTHDVERDGFKGLHLKIMTEIDRFNDL